MTTTGGDRLAASLQGLWKRFADRWVVQDVSLAVHGGQVLGLVGPNGAGKTTTIRMLLGIFRPDQGTVTVLGQPINDVVRERVGYLPEERGLYQGQRVLDILVYLGQLKGLPRPEAAQRAGELLARLDMDRHSGKKVKELSRGMAQLIQFAATIIHRPALVVLDEPFAALDPVNVRLMEEMIGELRQEGAAIILSTHLMNQVEELCDQVVMIDEGRVVLEGRLADLKRRFRGDALFVACDPYPDGLDGVSSINEERDGYTLHLDGEASPEQVLRQLLEHGVSLERFEVATPSMEDIFLAVVSTRRG